MYIHTYIYVYIYIYIYMYMHCDTHICIHIWDSLRHCLVRRPHLQDAPASIPLADNLRTWILVFGGSDSSRILIVRGGILMSMGNFLEVLVLSRRIVAGIILVGRLGAARPPHELWTCLLACAWEKQNRDASEIEHNNHK